MPARARRFYNKRRTQGPSEDIVSIFLRAREQRPASNKQNAAPNKPGKDSLRRAHDTCRYQVAPLDRKAIDSSPESANNVGENIDVQNEASINKANEILASKVESNTYEDCSNTESGNVTLNRAGSVAVRGFMSIHNFS